MKELRDFTATRRLIPISLVAMAIGVLSSFVALVLLRLIGLVTNLCFYQRWDTSFASPADHQLGMLVMLVPVLGGLAIGLMARFGSEKIRGHGIPEALESILMRGSRVEAKLAVLKPISAAVSIGSGGPFGAEGPIIMTGGAFGSLVAQRFHLTAAERKTLLVAGSSAGMAATFGTPLAATLLAVELLLSNGSRAASSRSPSPARARWQRGTSCSTRRPCSRSPAWSPETTSRCSSVASAPASRRACSPWR